VPDTWVGLAVALLAIVPGFLATTVWARARTWRGPSTDLRTILQSLALSGAIQVVISPLTVAWIVPIRNNLGDHAGRVALWFFLAVLALPLIFGVAVARVTDLIFDPSRSATRRYGWAVGLLSWVLKAPWPPSIWDWLFTTGIPDGRFVLVEFKDGTQVGGVFAAGSMALTSPEPQGLYIADEWLVDEDGDFTSPMPASRGILVPRVDDVRWVRILASQEELAEGGTSNG
jgi:uncharacterized protein DUF6338